MQTEVNECEDNLFDSGLYVGIGGTAIALVLQVLGVIQPSLLAAYSSNLFGITCVAVIKIFHVRACKQRLLLPVTIKFLILILILILILRGESRPYLLTPICYLLITTF